MKRHLIIIICSLLPLIVMAQMRITGTVTDMNGDPLTGVIIQVRSNSTNKMIRFGKTDAKGVFSLEAAANSYLEVSMLGFKKQRIDNLSNEKPLRIVMQEEAVALKEVTVKASKVREHGDTLTYNVATFADQNDRNIGDVLSRIPGFEVNKQNGQIKYEGKPISKFYIEGLDMLGDKYGIATNSLPQVDVGSVQVMRNHQSHQFTATGGCRLRAGDEKPSAHPRAGGLHLYRRGSSEHPHEGGGQEPLGDFVQRRGRHQQPYRIMEIRGLWPAIEVRLPDHAYLQDQQHGAGHQQGNNESLQFRRFGKP